MRWSLAALGVCFWMPKRISPWQMTDRLMSSGPALVKRFKTSTLLLTICEKMLVSIRYFIERLWACVCRSSCWLPLGYQQKDEKNPDSAAVWHYFPARWLNDLHGFGFELEFFRDANSLTVAAGEDGGVFLIGCLRDGGGQAGVHGGFLECISSLYIF
jgi:hypothetical protein